MIGFNQNDKWILNKSETFDKMNGSYSTSLKFKYDLNIKVLNIIYILNVHLMK